MRGLIVHRPGSEPGGDVAMAQGYAAALDRLGIEAELAPAGAEPEVNTFDFIHLWAACSPDWGYNVAYSAVQKEIPLIITPMWWGRERRQRHYGMGGYDLFPGYTQQVGAILSMASVLFVPTMSEAVECWKIAPNVPVVKTGLSCRQPQVDSFGTFDFVLCLGRIERHKNQHMLAAACQTLGYTLVCAGTIFNQDVAQRVRESGGQIIEQMQWQAAMNLLNTARVHALPSFSESGGAANMEACLLGIPAVMGDTTEPEFFGDGGIYCTPTDFNSVCRALELAWSRPHGQWAKFPTWDEVAQRAATWLHANI